MSDSAPVFIKLDEYKEVKEIVEVIKKKLAESTQTLERLKHLKAEEDEEIQRWENNLDDIFNKVENINSQLTEPKF